MSAAKYLHVKFQLHLGDNVRGSQDAGIKLHVVPLLWVNLKPGGSEKRFPTALALPRFSRMLSMVS